MINSLCNHHVDIVLDAEANVLFIFLGQGGKIGHDAGKIHTLTLTYSSAVK